MNYKAKYVIPLLALALLVPPGIGAQAVPGGEDGSSGPVGTANEQSGEPDYAMISRLTDPPEFVGQYTTDARQIGDYLYVKHIYSSDGLEHLGVDHIFREEVFPIPPTASDEDIARFVDSPTGNSNHTMSLVHGDDVSTFDRIRIGDTEVSSQAFQQWEIVREGDSLGPTNVSYTTVSHVEDWASKESDNVYQSYDPINLIWSDTVPGSASLKSKVDSKMNSSGWDEDCLYSSSLHINIGGTWTSQHEHYTDNLWGLCNQYHIRAWEINNDSMIGSAHEEVLRFKHWDERVDTRHISDSGPNYLEFNTAPFIVVYHSLTGFDSAEDEAAGEFTGGCWDVEANSHNLGNQYTRKTLKEGTVQDTAHNNGYATVISCS